MILAICYLAVTKLIAQTDTPKFYLGASYGTSFSLGDFNDTNPSNPDAGFADDGTKLDIYGGFFLNDRVTLLGTFRYQTFNSEIASLIDEFSTENPEVNFSGNAEDWKVYYLLFGVAYKVNISKKFSFFPRVGVGPMLVTNPGISISSPDEGITQNFSRSFRNRSGIGF